MTRTFAGELRTKVAFNFLQRWCFNVDGDAIAGSDCSRKLFGNACVCHELRCAAAQKQLSQTIKSCRVLPQFHVIRKRKHDVVDILVDGVDYLDLC